MPHLFETLISESELDKQFSDYIVYVDESGDANLDKIDPNFPTFVLSFCIFKKSDYANHVIPCMSNLKFSYFGHDMVVLHERELRKREGIFSSLNLEKRTTFMEELTTIIKNSEMTIIAIVIKKSLYVNRYKDPTEPYSLAMLFGLERLRNFLADHGQSGKTFIVCESRGKAEDKNLELAFRRICDGINYHGTEYPFEIVFAHKQINSNGLQLADLTARPIGQFVTKPDQPNRTYEILKEKFRKGHGDSYFGYGLKVVP